MSKTIQVISGSDKQSCSFPIENLKKIEFFKSRFSERWNIKEEEECIIENDKFTMNDLKVLIEQIIENSNINPLEVHYNQLPSIVVCADYFQYPIDKNIICTFLYECVPTIPWTTIDKWLIDYENPPYKALIDGVKQFLVGRHTFTQAEQKKILSDCVWYKAWHFQWWFVDDNVFVSVFNPLCSKYHGSNDKEGVRFLWELLCRKNYTHLWKREKIVIEIIKLISNKIGSDEWADLRLEIIKVIITWGLNKDERYLNLIKNYQNFDQYIQWYLDGINSDYNDYRTKYAKDLIDIAMKSSQRWNEMTSKYTVCVLLKETIKWCVKDPVWLRNILKSFNRKKLKYS